MPISDASAPPRRYVSTHETQTGVTWRAEFDCDGAPFVWTGRAAARDFAELLARVELSNEFAGFSRFGARLLSLDLAP